MQFIPPIKTREDSGTMLHDFVEKKPSKDITPPTTSQTIVDPMPEI
jgi:hypothetical protein